MAWYEQIPKIVGAVIPTTDADPAHQYKWRVAIAGVVLAMALTQVAHVLIACGWLATWGVTGFAYAADVEKIAEAQQRTEVRQIKNTLISQEQAFCRAKDKGAPTLFIYQLIAEAMKDYHAVTGETWVRPSCEELGE